jgi:hypothetical protein
MEYLHPSYFDAKKENDGNGSAEAWSTRRNCDVFLLQRVFF